MDFQLNFQGFLSDRFMQMKGRNSSYSMRSFAKKLGVSSAALSEILNGKRKVSKKLAERLLDNLNESPEIRFNLLKYADSKKSKDNTLTRQAIQLQADQYRLISEWYHFAILSLSETEDFNDDPKWIANRLSISVQDVRLALERLERLELIDRNSDGKLIPTGIEYFTPDEVSSSSLKRLHHKNLELAAESLDRESVDERDFTGMNMAIDPKKIPEAKKMVREFRKELSDFLESGDKKEVYKMCIQLFPLTNLKDKK